MCSDGGASLSPLHIKIKLAHSKTPYTVHSTCISILQAFRCFYLPFPFKIKAFLNAIQTYSLCSTVCWCNYSVGVALGGLAVVQGLTTCETGHYADVYLCCINNVLYRLIAVSGGAHSLHKIVSVNRVLLCFLGLHRQFVYIAKVFFRNGFLALRRQSGFVL